MDILDDMGVSKLSAIFIFFKENYSFKHIHLSGILFVSLVKKRSAL